MSVSDQTKAVSDYITRRYGSNGNRNWWGIAHRRWLVSSGRYVRTSSPSLKAQRATRQMARGFREGYGYAVGEAGPELINFRSTDRRTIRARCLDEMGDEHWPGCGCA